MPYSTETDIGKAKDIFIFTYNYNFHLEYCDL